MFADWLKNVPVDPDAKFPKRIREMWKLYGKIEGKKCKTCKHLFCVMYSRNYYKCEESNVTHGAGTDWQVNFTACGKHEEGKQEKYIGSH